MDDDPINVRLEVDDTVDSDDVPLKTAAGTLVAEVLAEDLFAEDARRYARRLVACWNACRGVDTETLEASRKEP